MKKTFSLGEDAARLLETLAQQFYAGNQTEVVRAGVRALAVRHGLEMAGHETPTPRWVVGGYVIGTPEGDTQCCRCGQHVKNEVLYRPVFRRGWEGQQYHQETHDHLPDEELWVCWACIEAAGQGAASARTG